MANGTVLNVGSGGDTITNIDNTTKGKTPVAVLTDATATNYATVKTASTAIATTDLPLAVGLHPSSPVPAGTNVVGKVGLDQTTPGTTNALSLAQIGATTIVTGGVAGTLAVGGMTAVNAASTGNPEFCGGIALVAANPTKAANAQRTGLATDAIGRVILSSSHERTMVGNQVTTISSSTAETTIVTAGGAGVFNDLTCLTITNGSATATIVTLKDATAGTTRGIYNLAAGGGVSIPFPTPKAQASANANWTLTCGASVASVYVVAEFVKNS